MIMPDKAGSANDKKINQLPEEKISDDDFAIETDDGILDPLELGHREADRIIEDERMNEYTRKNQEDFLKERQKIIDEDREEMIKTYQRF